MTKKERLKLIRETEKALTARRKALRDDVEKRIAEEEGKAMKDLTEKLGMDGLPTMGGLKVFSRLEVRSYGIYAVFSSAKKDGSPSKSGEVSWPLSYFK